MKYFFAVLFLTLPINAICQDQGKQALIEEVPLAKGFRFQSGLWGFSTSVLGPMKQSRETIWANAAPASVVFDPGITQRAQVRISVYKTWWKSGQDPAVRYEVSHNGEKHPFILDTASGHESGWVEIGTYFFHGKGGEYVTLSKENPTANTRASAMRFEILPEGTGKVIYINPPSRQAYETMQMVPLNQYADLAPGTLKHDVEVMAHKGFLASLAPVGHPFEANKPLSRSEFLEVLKSALGKFGGAGDLQKVLATDWPLASRSKTDEAISHEEMATAMEQARRLLGKETNWMGPYPPGVSRGMELVSVAPWARTGWDTMHRSGVLSVEERVSVKPRGPVHRGEALQTLKRFMETHAWSGPRTGKKWILSFQDEFQGETLDRSKWDSEAGMRTKIASRWPENAVVTNGLLRLMNRKESRGGGEWTCASIWANRQNYGQFYGYWEARLRYAKTPCINNAWWMMTKSGPFATKESFEIDINEGHYPNVINSSYHSGAGRQGLSQIALPGLVPPFIQSIKEYANGSPEKMTYSIRHIAPYDLSGDFHNYAI